MRRILTMDIVLKYCWLVDGREVSVRRGMVNRASSEVRGGTVEAEFAYPLVNTFNSDVFPQAPSPLHMIIPASVMQPPSPTVERGGLSPSSPFFNSGVTSGGQPTAIPACAGPFCFLHKATKASCSIKILYGYWKFGSIVSRIGSSDQIGTIVAKVVVVGLANDDDESDQAINSICLCGMERRIRVSSGVRSDEDGIGVMEVVVGGAANDSRRWMDAAAGPALFLSVQLIHLVVVAGGVYKWSNTQSGRPAEGGILVVCLPVDGRGKAEKAKRIFF